MRVSRSPIFHLLLALAFFQSGFAAAAKKTPSQTKAAAPSKTTVQFKTLDAVIEDAIEQKQCPGAVLVVGHGG